MTTTEQKVIELLEHVKTTAGLPANLPKELSILIRKFFKASEVSFEVSRIMSIKPEAKEPTFSTNKPKLVLHRPSPKMEASSAMVSPPVPPVDDEATLVDNSEQLFLKLAATDSIEEAYKLFDRDYKNLALFIKRQGWDITADSNDALLSKVLDLCRQKVKDAEQ